MKLSLLLPKIVIEATQGRSGVRGQGEFRVLSSFIPRVGRGISGAPTRCAP